METSEVIVSANYGAPFSLIRDEINSPGTRDLKTVSPNLLLSRKKTKKNYIYYVNSTTALSVSFF